MNTNTTLVWVSYINFPELGKPAEIIIKETGTTEEFRLIYDEIKYPYGIVYQAVDFLKSYAENSIIATGFDGDSTKNYIIISGSGIKRK